MTKYLVKYKNINGLLLVFIKKMYEISSKCIKEKVRTLYYKFTGAAHSMEVTTRGTYSRTTLARQNHGLCSFGNNKQPKPVVNL